MVPDRDSRAYWKLYDRSAYQHINKMLGLVSANSHMGDFPFK